MLEIALRPELLDYRNTITLGGVVLTLDVAYRVRTDDWWLSLYDEEGAPIITGRRIVTGWPLTIGVFDTRLPQGLFVALRLGEGEADARLGELGRDVVLTFFEPDDLAALAPATDPLAPRAVLSIAGP